MTIHLDAEIPPDARDLHAIPLSCGLLNFVRPAKTLHVFPRIAAGSVEALDLGSLGYAVDRKISAAHDQDIARAALNDLRLDRLGPNLVFADKMNEDAAVASIVCAWSPGLFAPFELGDELVVGVVGLA